MNKMSQIINITDKKFGKLTVLKFAYMKNHNAYWECQCDCGNIKIINGVDLRRGLKGNGGTKTCGCSRIEVSERRKGISNETVKIEYMKASKNVVFGNYKYSAKRRKISFELSFEEFISICERECYYCGALPSQVNRKGSYYGLFVHNGVDRVNNFRGYTLDNCVSCCKICNQAKSKMSDVEFFDWINRILLHQRKKIETWMRLEDTIKVENLMATSEYRKMIMNDWLNESKDHNG